MELFGPLDLFIRFVTLFIIVGGSMSIANSIKNNRKNKQQAHYIVGEAGFTELMLSAKVGDIETCNRLIESGVNINHQDDKGATALLYAVLAESEDIVKLMIDKGANPYISTKKGLTAITFAENNKLINLIKILKSSQATV